MTVPLFPGPADSGHPARDPGQNWRQCSVAASIEGLDTTAICSYEVYLPEIKATDSNAPTIPAFWIGEMRSFSRILAKTTVLAG